MVPALAISARAQEQQQQPPEVMKLVQAITAAVNGDDAAVQKLVNEHFTASYRDLRPIEARQDWFKPLRENLGTITVGSQSRTAPDTFQFLVKGAKGGVLTLVVKHDEAFKITALSILQ